MPTPAPALPTAGARGRLSTRADSRSASLALHDLGDDAGAGIEEPLVDLPPPAEVLDRELPRRHGEAELLRRAAQHGPVAVLPEDQLAGLRAQVGDERARRGPV